MKLFELSSFSASLRRKNRSFPLIPPFVELPYIGSLVRIPLSSDPTFHRSFAIAGAIVVPTAADLAFGIPFVGDRQVIGPRHYMPPWDRCLYEPKPPEKPKEKPKDKNIQVAQEISDNCATAPPSKRQDDSIGSGEKYVVRRLASSSELSPSVRAYHKKLIGCFKNWQASECDNFTLNDVESEVR
jgi:hypothetical protein